MPLQATLLTKDWSGKWTIARNPSEDPREVKAQFLHARTNRASEKFSELLYLDTSGAVMRHAFLDTKTWETHQAQAKKDVAAFEEQQRRDAELRKKADALRKAAEAELAKIGKAALAKDREAAEKARQQQSAAQEAITKTK